jgi:hypothetical protein
LQAARATVQAGGVHSHAARVIAPIFKPLQALHKDGNNVAVRNSADDATHMRTPDGVFYKNWSDGRADIEKFQIKFNQIFNFYFMKFDWRN